MPKQEEEKPVNKRLVYSKDLSRDIKKEVIRQDELGVSITEEDLCVELITEGLALRKKENRKR